MKRAMILAAVVAAIAAGCEGEQKPGELLALQGDSVGAHGASSYLALDRYRQLVKASDQVGVDEMLRDGRVFIIANGTLVRVINSGADSAEVRIEDGSYAGRAVFVDASSLVPRNPNKSSGTEPVAAPAPPTIAAATHEVVADPRRIQAPAATSLANLADFQKAVASGDETTQSAMRTGGDVLDLNEGTKVRLAGEAKGENVEVAIESGRFKGRYLAISMKSLRQLRAEQ